MSKILSLKSQVEHLKSINMHNFQELKIWQKSMDITEQTYRLSAEFPKEEKYGLTSQIRRSAVSIPSNELIEIQKMNYALILKFSKKI